MVEITATEQNIEQRMKRNEDSLRDLWGNMKWINILIIGVPEGEETGKGPECGHQSKGAGTQLPAGFELPVTLHKNTRSVSLRPKAIFSAMS